MNHGQGAQASSRPIESMVAVHGAAVVLCVLEPSYPLLVLCPFFYREKSTVRGHFYNSLGLGPILAAPACASGREAYEGLGPWPQNGGLKAHPWPTKINRAVLPAHRTQAVERQGSAGRKQCGLHGAGQWDGRWSPSVTSVLTGLPFSLESCLGFVLHFCLRGSLGP